jgi:hypothetical protein
VRGYAGESPIIIKGTPHTGRRTFVYVNPETSEVLHDPMAIDIGVEK